MKRVVIYIICMCSSLCLGLRAQDTIPEYYQYYYYQWVDDSSAVCTHDGWDCYRDFWRHTATYPHPNPYINVSGTEATEEKAYLYNITDTLEIIGLAMMADDGRYNGMHDIFNDSTMTLDTFPYSLCIYKPAPDGEMRLLQCLPVDLSVETWYMHVRGMAWGMVPPSDFGSDIYFPVYEVYFDSSFKLTDSFYVSLRWTLRYINVDLLYFAMELTEHHWNYLYDQEETHRMPISKFRYRVFPPDYNTWYSGEFYGAAYVMPIVRWAGDTCPEVRELRYSVLARDGAFVQWGGHENHALYELSYGPVGTAPGEGTVVECAVPQRYLAGLERGVDYEVYVRARCDFARSEWTAWSDALLVEADSVATASAAGPEQGQRLFSVAPNPARGAATVTLAAEAAATGCSLTLRDEAGRIAMQRTVAAGTAAVELDLRGLEAGVYVITVKTGRGVETGKLKIEKW